MDIRKEIGRRITTEMQRRGLQSADIIVDSGLDADIVSAYLAGKRNIQFSELGPICAAMGVSVMRLLTNSDVSRVRIAYRKTRSSDRKVLADAENVFLWLEDFLPVYHHPPVTLPQIDATSEARMLIAEIVGFVDRLKKVSDDWKYWYTQIGVGLIGTNRFSSSGDSLDGVCLLDAKHSLVFVNTDRPDVRLWFTVLHELWHAICDRNKDIPADYLPSGLYDEVLSNDTKPEFCANKFAQFWMIPFETAQDLYHKMQRPSGLCKFDVENALANTGASAEVLANAVYDVARYHSRPRVSYASIRDQVKSLGASWSGKPDARDFLALKNEEIRDTIDRHEEKFGEHARLLIGSFLL